MRWKVIGLIVFAIIIAAFTLDNTTAVNVNFIFVTATTKLIFVILLSVLLGMILMAILWSLRAWKLRSQVGGLKKQLAKAEDELKTLQRREEERIQEDQTNENPSSDKIPDEEENTEISPAKQDGDHKKHNESAISGTEALSDSEPNHLDVHDDNR